MFEVDKKMYQLIHLDYISSVQIMKITKAKKATNAVIMEINSFNTWGFWINDLLIMNVTLWLPIFNQGNGTSGTSIPRNSHSGFHPCLTKDVSIRWNLAKKLKINLQAPQAD